MKFEYIICGIVVAIFIYLVLNKDSFSQYFDNPNEKKTSNNNTDNTSKCTPSNNLIS